MKLRIKEGTGVEKLFLINCIMIANLKRFKNIILKKLRSPLSQRTCCFTKRRSVTISSSLRTQRLVEHSETSIIDQISRAPVNIEYLSQQSNWIHYQTKCTPKNKQTKPASYRWGHPSAFKCRKPSSIGNHIKMQTNKWMNKQ